MDDLPPRSSWRVPKPTAALLPPQIEGLIEESTDALPVRVTIVQDGVRTGWDDGAMGFEPDAVWFSGRACSFRIVAPDIRSVAYGVSGHEISCGESLMPLRHPTRRVVVEVAVIARPDHSEWRDYQRAVGAIRRLRACPTREGESQYPPLTVRPGLIETPEATRRGQMIVATVIVVWLCLLARYPEAKGTVFALITLVMVSTTLATSRRSTATLRRIAAEEVSGGGSPCSRGKNLLSETSQAARAKGGTVGGSAEGGDARTAACRSAGVASQVEGGPCEGSLSKPPPPP